MQFISENEQLEKTFRRLLHQQQHVSFAVAWASHKLGLFGTLMEHRQKIKQGVVGTSFFHTSAEFIEVFLGEKNVKFIVPAIESQGVFHPKIYFFFSDEEKWDCLIGSANFTSGGFNKNQEATLHISSTDPCTNSPSSAIRAQISEYWKRPDARHANKIDLKRYRNQRKRAKAKTSVQNGKKSTTRPKIDIGILSDGWDVFYEKVKSDTKHGIAGRIKVLAKAHCLFKEHDSLMNMNTDDRKGIAGMINQKSINWKWFGSTTPAGIFKGLFNNDATIFSEALDLIPLDRPIQKEDYKSFVEKYKSAFKQAGDVPKGHGLGTATRLLAMKRPDHFLCYNRANKEGLHKQLGYRVAHQDFDGYWESIITPLMETPWWDSPRPPKGKPQAVWDRRMAFLDAFLYEPL